MGYRRFTPACTTTACIFAFVLLTLYGLKDLRETYNKLEEGIRRINNQPVINFDFKKMNNNDGWEKRENCDLGGYPASLSRQHLR